MKVFLDDVRQPEEAATYMHLRIGKLSPIYLEDWEVVKNYKQFTNLISNYYREITHVSFDHDLADIHYDPKTWRESFKYHEETGYDCAKYLLNFYKERNLKLPIMFVHSMNSVGTQNIINLFKNNE